MSKKSQVTKSSIVFLQVLAAVGIAVPWFDFKNRRNRRLEILGAEGTLKNWGVETGNDGLHGSEWVMGLDRIFFNDVYRT